MLESTVDYFNSIKVRLKPTAELRKCYNEYNFNSIKVRLKLETTRPNSLSEIFQFHKGTIKTKKSRRSIAVTKLFQFHKGTIKTQIEQYYHHHRQISIP